MPEIVVPPSSPSPLPEGQPMPAGVTPGTYKCPVEGLSEDQRFPNTQPAGSDPSPYSGLR